ncbi:MAG TPA: hypothetical protein VLG28_13370 [Acidimicrobiia bacterium]|nr:hypothetical protein [Acidimicrobiia bacterium]
MLNRLGAWRERRRQRGIERHAHAAATRNGSSGNAAHRNPYQRDIHSSGGPNAAD